jgi:hypothetical protein
MPVFNIASKIVTGTTVTSVNNSTSNSTTNSTVHGTSFITEDLSNQIGDPHFIYVTSYKFVPLSLEVFINGIMMLCDADFTAITDCNGFRLIQHDINLHKVLCGGSPVVAKYIAA